MAIANVARGGSATNTTTSATTLSITVTAAAGDTIVVAASTLAANATTSVTDNAAGGSNKYYMMGDIAGASGRISMWISFNGKACTTITVTHVASRASGSASTYTGVLGAGQTKTATNAANNNTITLTNAVAAGNVMVASMGDAVGTQTWTAVTGTLRNNIAGGGTTTPGATNMDTLVSGGSTLAASLSSSVSGEAVAIELFSAQQAMASINERFENLDNPPFMWMLNPLQLLDDREQHEYAIMTPQGVGGVNMMGFRGAVVYPSAMAWYDDWSFVTTVATPVRNSFDQDELLWWPDYNQQQVEEDQFGQQIAAVVTAKSGFDQDEPFFSNQAFTEGETEQDNWGLFTAITGGGGTQMMGFRGYRVLRAAMEPIAENEAITEDFIHEMVVVDLMYVNPPLQQWHFSEDDQFGFQTQVVQVITPYDFDYVLPWADYNQIQVEDDQSDFSTDIAIQQELPDINPSYFVVQWTDDDKTDSTFFAREQYADADEQPIVLGQATKFHEEDFGFYVPFESLVDEQFAQWLIVSGHQVELDQHGQNPPFLTTNAESWEQWGQLANPPYPITHQVELDQHGQNAPFLTATPFDETIDQKWVDWRWLDQIEEWAFNTPEIEGELLLEEELQQPNQPYPLWQQVEDEQYGLKAPFIPSYPDDDSPFQYARAWQWLDQIEEWSYEPASAQNPYDEDNWENYARGWTANQEDEPWVFVRQVILPWDEEQGNIPQQQSYYFQSEDLEKYNWGWMPPMTKVTEDDTPYDAPAQMRSYFNPALEDDTFNFGLWRYFSFDQDETPVITTQQRWTHEEDFGFQRQAVYSSDDTLEQFVVAQGAIDAIEDFGQSVQFYADASGDVDFASGSSVRQDDESGMFGFGVEGPFDQSAFEVYPSVQSVVQETEEFGFRQQVFLGADDSLEQFPTLSMVRVDEDYFGFNTPTAQVFTAFADEDQIPTQVRTYGEDEPFGFQFQMATEFGEQTPVEQRAFSIQDEQFGHIIVIADAQVNIDLPEQMIRVGDEQVPVQQTAQPFSYGDEIDHLPNQPYPVVAETEQDNWGLNAPYVFQPYAWEEDGLPPNQPWPVLDVTDYSDWLFNVTTSIMKIYNVAIRNVLAIIAMSAVNQLVQYETLNRNQFTAATAESVSSIVISEIESHSLMSIESVQERPQSNN